MVLPVLVAARLAAAGAAVAAVAAASLQLLDCSRLPFVMFFQSLLTNG